MKPLKRLFYVPGLISLIFLLIVFPIYFKKIVPVKEFCLDLVVPNDNYDTNEFSYTFSKYNFEKYISKKKKIKFTLDENQGENSKKMGVIRFEALKLKYTEDTATVVLLTLSDSISYGEFVNILDMCYYDDHKKFASWENKFVIFGGLPRKKAAENRIESFLYNDVLPIKNRPVKINLLEKHLRELGKYYTWQGLTLLIGWLILTLSFIYFRKNTLNIEEIPN